MEIRDARTSDVEEIQQIARESLGESYGHALGDETIESATENWYAEDEIEEKLSGDNSLMKVAADGDETYGFVEGEYLQGDPVIGDIHWLHVRPSARGEGIGVQLLGEIVETMEKNNASLVRGHVIEANEDGAAFYEEHGFEQSSTDTVAIGDEEYEEQVYEKRVTEGAGEEIFETVEGPDGEELYVDYAAGETGTDAPMYPTFTDSTREERFGYMCSNCGSTDTAMSASGRIQCNNCGNTRKATRWDESYL